MSKAKKKNPRQRAAPLINKLLSSRNYDSNATLPFVSVVTPTFQRRDFLPYLIYQFQYQDYPADKRELVILDDSPQSNQDLVEMLADPAQPNIRYIHSEQRLALGKKRNMLNQLARGEYIICFDDDDYYPPEKIRWQIGEMQRQHALFSGCDQIYIWYSHLNKTYLSNAFGRKHALNGTFCFHRNFLKKHRYDDEALSGEESSFLNFFTAPVLQLDCKKAILCISHSSNTFDKDYLLHHTIPVDLTLEDFVQDANLLAHFRRLSVAPCTVKVAWQTFTRVAVLYAREEEAQLATQLQALEDFGMDKQQLLPIAKVSAASASEAELLTHCAVLEQAIAAGWQKVLLLDAAISFVKKSFTVDLVNKLFSGLDDTNWQVLLLGARHESLTQTDIMKGAARVMRAGCGCAYAVNGSYMPTLLEAYQKSLKNDASLDQIWPYLMTHSCWIGFSPSFAYLQEIKDPQTGDIIDCTHWFFRRPER